jgi:hypothetical protein
LGPIFDSSAALRNHLVAENEYLKTSILSASLGGRGPSSEDDGIDDPRSVVRKVAVGGGERDNRDTDGDDSYSNDNDDDGDDDGISDSDGDGDSSINTGIEDNSSSSNNDDDSDAGDEIIFGEKETIKEFSGKNVFKMESDSQKRGGKENQEKIHSKIRDGIKIVEESIYDPRSLVNLNGGEGESESESEENMEEGSEQSTDTVDDEGNEYKMMMDFDVSDVADVDEYLTDYRSKVDDVLKDLLSDLKGTDTGTGTNNSKNITGHDKNKNADKNKSKVKSITSSTKKKSGINKGKSSENSRTPRDIDSKNKNSCSPLENIEINITSPISEFAKNALKYKSMLLCFFVAVLMHYSIVSGILK